MTTKAATKTVTPTKANTPAGIAIVANGKTYQVTPLGETQNFIKVELPASVFPPFDRKGTKYPQIAYLPKPSTK